MSKEMKLIAEFTVYGKSDLQGRAKLTRSHFVFQKKDYFQYKLHVIFNKKLTANTIVYVPLLDFPGHSDLKKKFHLKDEYLRDKTRIILQRGKRQKDLKELNPKKDITFSSEDRLEFQVTSDYSYDQLGKPVMAKVYNQALRLKIDGLDKKHWLVVLDYGYAKK